MLWQSVRFALLAGVCLAGTAVSVRADDAESAKDGKEAKAACPMVKIQVWECVEEKVPCKRITCKIEQRCEEYTAYRCECVQEQRCRTVTTYRTVCETKDVTRCYYVSVPCVEERCVMKAHWVCKPVTRTVRKCVDMGHYECREVPCGPTLCERLKKLCGNDCCEPCPRTKIEKVWVKCPTWVETQVTKNERVCEYRPEVCRVNTCKKELRTEVVKVNYTRCIPECKTEHYMANVQKLVPYKATRTVCVSVPHEECVTVSRMVPRLVTKEVPADSISDCGPCCNPCPKTRCCK